MRYDNNTSHASCFGECGDRFPNYQKFANVGCNARLGSTSQVVMSVRIVLAIWREGVLK